MENESAVYAGKGDAKRNQPVIAAGSGRQDRQY
jgi:hypothetical protein